MRRSRVPAPLRERRVPPPLRGPVVADPELGGPNAWGAILAASGEPRRLPRLVPPPPVTPEVDEFLRRPNPAVVATVRPDGSPHSVPTWYDWDGELVHLNMDVGRARLGHLRLDPRVALTVIDEDDWYRHVSLRGRVIRMEADDGLAGIDRLSQRYRGRPYRVRDRGRVNAWMRPERWHA